jgi:hypothetical protein
MTPRLDVFLKQFAKERQYLKAVTSTTLAWYRHSFHAFQPVLEMESTASGSSGIGSLRLPFVRIVTMDPVFPVIPLFLFEAFLTFFALLAAIAHKVASSTSGAAYSWAVASFAANTALPAIAATPRAAIAMTNAAL